MKPNTGKYREVNQLPNGAMSVRGYADVIDCTTSYIYKLVKSGKNLGRFEMVLFQGANFVIPN